MGSLAYLIQVLLCFNKQVLLCFMLVSQNDDDNTITQKFLNHYISVLDCGDFFLGGYKRYHHLKNRRNIDGFNASKTCNGVVIVRPQHYNNFYIHRSHILYKCYCASLSKCFCALCHSTFHLASVSYIA